MNDENVYNKSVKWWYVFLVNFVPKYGQDFFYFVSVFCINILLSDATFLIRSECAAWRVWLNVYRFFRSDRIRRIRSDVIRCATIVLKRFYPNTERFKRR